MGYNLITMINKKVDIKRLSPRECEIIKLLAYEYSSKEIADHLYVGYETVKTHRKNIISKLGVKNVAGAIRVSFEFGILTLASLRQPM